MTQRYRVEHSSHYRYANRVNSSFNEARITPIPTDGQVVLESRVEVEPAASLYSYVDYWGSVVHAFDIQKPHWDLNVTASSVVEISPPAKPQDGVGWEELERGSTRDEWVEFLSPTRHVPTDGPLVQTATQLRRSPRPLQAVWEAICWVRSELTYLPGTTGVHTSAIEAWEGGAGVCQDFAHLSLALLRSAGIPARYCSGYVHPSDDAAVGECVEGQSHAWVEAWTGSWSAFDPTAGTPVGEGHVLVARGRDYTDVSPVKGIFHGGPTAGLDVAVGITRLA